jgi:iron complex outermembrane receptor protein
MNRPDEQAMPVALLADMDAGWLQRPPRCQVDRLARWLLLPLTVPFVINPVSVMADAGSESAADNSGALGEIVVTAQKRTSTVQDTPISIAATSGDELASRGITSFVNLAQSTPGVSLKSEGPSQTEIEMRGMTSSGGNSATVGFYLDDIPLSGPASAQNGHVVIDPTLYDLNRIEVLRGPQGTLFGSGSMGGTVRLITNQPNLTDVQSSAQSILSGTDGGGFNHNNNLMVNLPLVNDTLAWRLVFTENYTSGWINRIVANPFPVVNVTADAAIRGDVAGAPVEKEYSGSNAYHLYGARTSLLWKPSDNLTITPSIFYETSRQSGVSAYDSVPGIVNAHYQPFDIAEPLTDEITVSSLTVNYTLEAFDITSVTGYWTRRSTQEQDASEEFNNPTTAATYASNYGLPPPGYYGPGGTGEAYGYENDPSKQYTEELRFTSKGDGPLTWVGGAYYSHFYSLWTFNGTTANPSAYMDLGTFAPATTPHWFDAVSPTTMVQYAGFGDATYALSDNLKADAGLRVNKFNYHFSSCISGWGSGSGAAVPSCSGAIDQFNTSVTPKFNLSYEFDKDRMVYLTAASGFRPGGGDAVYPTTGAIWGPAFAPYHYTNGKWPTSYQSDKVWSYEVGEKARFFDRHVTVNASVFYEDWKNIQLEAYPNVWALNINGNKATIYGGEIDMVAVLGEGFNLELTGGYLHENLDAGPHWQIVPANKLPEVPTVTADAILSYLKPLNDKLSFTGKLETSYTGSRYSLEFPFGYQTNGEYGQLPGYSLTNVRAGIQSSNHWNATLFVNNAFNKHAQLENLFQLLEATTSFNRVVTNQPLTAGIDMSYRY